MEENKTTLPTTEDELKDLIAKAVSEKVEELTAKHNNEMAQARQKAKQDQEIAVQKAVDKATLSAEEQAKKSQDEERERLLKENAELKAKAHSGEVKEALTKEKLPLFLANDSRLSLAESEEDIANAIALVKKDYESSLPDGAQINTNVIATKQSVNEKAKEDAELERLRKLGIR